MALDPEILFFDEPSAGLDPISSNLLDRLILELRDGLGTTIVVVTHELASIFTIANDSIFLDAESRTALAQGPPKELLEHGEPKVRAFLTRGEQDGDPIYAALARRPSDEDDDNFRSGAGRGRSMKRFESAAQISRAGGAGDVARAGGAGRPGGRWASVPARFSPWRSATAARGGPSSAASAPATTDHDAARKRDATDTGAPDGGVTDEPTTRSKK
jgi:hypothetical protein